MNSRSDHSIPPRPGENAGPTPECARIGPLLEAYHDAALDEREAAWVAAHLAGCAYCSARLRRYAEIDLLIRSAPAPLAGPALREGLYRAINGSGRTTRADTALATLERDPNRSFPGHSFPGRSLPSAWRPTIPQRAPRPVWVAGIAAVCVILAFAVVFVALQRRIGPIGPTATATTTGPHQTGLLPAFHDWRAAYLDRFDGLHVVSLDGAHDTLITTLDGLSVFNSQGNRAAISADGRYLAYVDNPKWGNVHLVDLAASTPKSNAQRVISGKITDLSWSPDGRWLVASGTINGTLGLYRVDPYTGATTTLIASNSVNAAEVSWLDAAHLLIFAPQTGPSSNVIPPVARTDGGVGQTQTTPLSSTLSSGPFTYYVVDIATGTKQQTNEIIVPSGWAIWALLPGTTDALAESNGGGACGAPCPSTTVAYALLDYSTGQITKTPKINSVANGNIGYLSMDPVAGSGLFAATPYAVQPTQQQLFLFDPAHDGARPLATGLLPLGWTPDGNTLLTIDAASMYSTTGVGTLSILDLGHADSGPLAIAKDAVRYIGLVRTA